MAYKLLDMAQARWRRLDSAHLLPLVRGGVVFVDGVQQKGEPDKPRARHRVERPPTATSQDRRGISCRTNPPRATHRSEPGCSPVICEMSIQAGARRITWHSSVGRIAVNNAA